ncbi:DUF3341 domain-containing protein [Cytophagaceae bacterium ABcell3]|nr:DUF3341 domain-containing protein [Cytophagaceae bacterium ABcell3]
MAKGKNFLLGIYKDEDVLVGAVSKVRVAGVRIHEVYTPFPVHGLDEALGYKPSNLPIVAFIFGLTGTICALCLTILTMGYDWPMVIGGKPFIPLPNFIPVTFELTVLLASLGMVGTFFVISGLKPWGRPFMFDPRSTDDCHVMAIDLDRNKLSKEEISQLLTESGASEVNSKIVE